MNELNFEVSGNTYTIKVPTVGDMLQVERMKMALTGGYYNDMMKTGTVSAQETLLLVDIQSHLSILCPKLMTDLKCEDVQRLTPEDYSKLRKVYIDKFVPWWNNWLKLFKGEE